MSAPTLPAAATKLQSSVLATTHTITLPTHTQEQFLVIFALMHNDTNSSTFTCTTPTGWTTYGDVSVNAAAPGAGFFNRTIVRVWWLRSDGTETTASWTTSVAAVVGAVVIPVDIGLTTDSFLYETGTVTTSSNPPAVTWADGPWDTLAMTYRAIVDNTPNYGAPTVPAGYSLVDYALSANLGFGGGGHDGAARMELASQTLNGITSENPATWAGQDASSAIEVTGTVLFHRKTVAASDEPLSFQLARRRRKVDIKELPYQVSTKMVGGVAPRKPL